MRSRLVVSSLLLAVSLAAPAAHAQSVCGTLDSSLLPPDGRIFSYTAAASTTYAFVGATSLTTGGLPRSYSIELLGPNGAVSNTPNLYVKGESSFGCGPGNLGMPSLRDTSRIEPRVACDSCFFGNWRYSFTTSDRIAYFIVENDVAAALLYTISFAETTMFSPAWTTNGTNNTFYSIYNNTSQTVTAEVSLRTTAGASASVATLVIPAFSNVSTNTVALGTPRNVSGNARLTHDGPPGALLVEADIANFTSTPAYIQPVKFQAPREVR